MDGTDFIREIAHRLQSAGLGTVWNGTTGDIWVGDIPSEGGDVLMVMPDPSNAPDMELNTEYQTISFWTRYSNSKAGRDKLRQIYNLFHRAHHYDLDSYSVDYSHALGQVEDMDRDTEMRKLQKLSIRFIYHSLDYVS
jgi:hypothetical protein